MKGQWKVVSVSKPMCVFLNTQMRPSKSELRLSKPWSVQVDRRVHKCASFLSSHTSILGDIRLWVGVP